MFIRDSKFNEPWICWNKGKKRDFCSVVLPCMCVCVIHPESVTSNKIHSEFNSVIISKLILFFFIIFISLLYIIIIEWIEYCGWSDDDDDFASNNHHQHLNCSKEKQKNKTKKNLFDERYFFFFFHFDTCLFFFIFFNSRVSFKSIGLINFDCLVRVLLLLLLSF